MTIYDNEPQKTNEYTVRNKGSHLRVRATITVQCDRRRSSNGNKAPGNVNIAIIGDSFPTNVINPIGKHASWNNSPGNQDMITKDLSL